MTLLTLDQWLESNCGYLTMAVKDVPAGGDLQPFFAAMKDDMPMVFGLDLLQFDKAIAVQLFQAFLKTVGADQYAIIAAAWYVKLPRAEAAAAYPVIDREGTGGAYKYQRRECYQVTVGDHERSLIALFDVERDWKGKIRRLIRRTGGVPEGLFGRMVDLLVEFDGALMPGYWMNETSGVLRPAVEAYLAGGELSAAHVAALRAYLRQWVAAPWRGEGIDELRAQIDGLTSREALEAWLDEAELVGIDPL